MKTRYWKALLAAVVCGAASLDASDDSRTAMREALMQGREKVGAGDTAGAIAIYDAALDANKNSADLINARGEARLAAGDVVGADADFKRAVQLAGKWPTPYIGRARALIMQQKYSAAKAQLRTALTLKKDDPDALFLISVIMTEERQFTEAIKILNDLTEQLGDEAPAFLWLSLANAEVLAGNETAALIAFARHQKLEPQLSADAYLVRAYIRFASADYDSCLLDVARVEESGRSMLFFREAVSFARRDFASLAHSFETAIKQSGNAMPGEHLCAHVLRRAAGGGADAPKPAALPGAKVFAGTFWKPLYDYLSAKPEEKEKLAEKLAPWVAEGGKLDPEDAANFHLFAGIAMENDRRLEAARRQYDLAWAQGGTPEGAAWMARQLKLGLR